MGVGKACTQMPKVADYKVVLRQKGEMRLTDDDNE